MHRFLLSFLSDQHTEMSSFGEKKAIQLAKDQGKDFIGYTKRQLARIYPGGTRIDSSNYDPVTLWNAGCQLGKINRSGSNYFLSVLIKSFDENSH